MSELEANQESIQIPADQSATDFLKDQVAKVEGKTPESTPEPEPKPDEPTPAPETEPETPPEPSPDEPDEPTGRAQIGAHQLPVLVRGPFLPGELVG